MRLSQACQMCQLSLNTMAEKQGSCSLLQHDRKSGIYTLQQMTKKRGRRGDGYVNTLDDANLVTAGVKSGEQRVKYMQHTGCSKCIFLTFITCTHTPS